MKKKEIVFVPFCTFPGKPSASRPNYFDGPFYQGSLVLFLLIALNPCTIIPPLCLYQQLCWISNILRVHIQYLLPCYVLPSELLGLMWFISSCVTKGTSLGVTLGGLPGFLFCVCTFGDGVWCCYCILGYLCVTGAFTWYDSDASSSLSWRCPLCLLIDCCSADFGIMLNNSAGLLNAALWV